MSLPHSSSPLASSAAAVVAAFSADGSLPRDLDLDLVGGGGGGGGVVVVVSAPPLPFLLFLSSICSRCGDILAAASSSFSFMAKVAAVSSALISAAVRDLRTTVTSPLLVAVVVLTLAVLWAGSLLKNEDA